MPWRVNRRYGAKRALRLIQPNQADNYCQGNRIGRKRKKGGPKAAFLMRMELG